MPHVNWRPHVSLLISRSIYHRTCTIRALPHVEKQKRCAHRPSPYLKICQKAQFANEPRRAVSKIWRLLRSTHVVRRMLRYIDWCILCVVVRASVPTVPISAVAAFPLVSANNRKELDGVTAVVVDHHLDPWRCVGIVPAERGVTRVHAIFAPPAPHRSPQKARSGHTAVRARATFKAHTNKPRDTEKHLHSDKAHSENVTHSNEERNTIRGKVAPGSKRQHTTFTRSSRVINPNKQVAHDSVKCGSPDGFARRNFGWRSAR